ncbi:putative O-methyltransferase [Aspergillus clavatus NRRL 1]|uniref:O-methyltransferase, putative n=1 Tax=Aspergillus clavatus (strain ATCC 1007 / CBS 513.65 / DSM 816 / NCTC 3887 / NRRL 1 / QM 1276 / 107) TaxID=344612 RepID=A1C8H6_ASPCL|nr:O-methyltransferase, putative [Aspergillus clavatus NRRL 1]EAW13613.1 O-methyltransferase, putative [Aspergillus clavatus NRRL 1]
MAITEETDQYLSGVQKALQRLNGAAERCQSTLLSGQDNSLASCSARQTVRDDLVLEALKFLQMAQGPVDAAATCYERTAHFASVRALLEMGAFEALPTGGVSRSTQELAKELKVDESLLARLLRNSSLYGPFEETGPGQYCHTPFSEAYLRPEIRGMFRFAMDDHMPAHLKLHEFLQRNGWQEPSSTTDNPYTHAHVTNGKSMFMNLSEKPERMQAFNNGMTLQAITPLWMTDLFPWKNLSRFQPDASTVVAVDIGGGKGKAIARIKGLCGLPGRYILQDQGHVIQSVEGVLDPKIERMGYDFFTEQPVRGALSYLIRRCLHNWPQESVVRILKNVAAAMEPKKSCLLIEEIIVPAEKMGVEEGWMDMIMMSLGAKQRTLKEWQTVLDLAGLEVKQVYQIPGNCHGLIEAWRK